MKFRTFGAALACVLFMVGCADKSASIEYNQSADHWYKQIIESIVRGDLEKADSFYTSLSSEHVASPLLGEALLILAQAHMDDEEYAEANEALDEYLKRFGSSTKNEYIRYLKIKANYASFSRPNRNQQLIINTIADTKKFLDNYPESVYRPMVESMLVHMELGELLMMQNISLLYNKLNKKDASSYYKGKLDESVFGDTDVVEPTIPWYRKWFEW